MQRLLSEDQKDQRPLLCIPLFQESEQWHLQKALYMVPEIFHRRFPSYLCFLLMNHSLQNRLIYAVLIFLKLYFLQTEGSVQR